MTKLIGVYFKRHSSYISVLRFYDDNSVVKISSSAKIDEVIIHKRMSYSASGTYEIYESDKIRFSLKSSNGTIDYFGRVLDNTTLDLHSKSNINGNESQNIYKLRELVVPKPIQPKASEYKRLENPIYKQQKSIACLK